MKLLAHLIQNRKITGITVDAFNILGFHLHVANGSAVQVNLSEIVSVAYNHVLRGQHFEDNSDIRFASKLETSVRFENDACC